MARELLEASIQKQLGEGRSGVRVTREQRAQLLGLSVVTCNRLFKGEGVDRQSLKVAFECMGLTWDDDYCEYVRPAPSDSPSADRSPSARSRHRLFQLLGVAATILFIALAAYLNSNSKDPVPPNSPEDKWTRFTVLLHAAGNRYHAGDFETARARASEAIALARESQNAGSLASTLRIIGDLEAAAGSYATAMRYYEEALRLRQALLDRRSEPAILEAMGSVEIRLKEFGQAHTHLQASLRGYKNEGDKTGISMAKRTLGELMEHQYNRKAARQFYRESLAEIAGSGHPDMEIDLKARLATLDAADGAIETALAQLNRCLEYWQRRNHPRWIATTLRQLGYVKGLRGDGPGALADLKRSQQLFRAAGDRAGVSECETLASRLQPPSGASRRNKIAATS